MKIGEMQAALKEEGLDGWLFFDHHHRDPIAYRVLQFTPGSSVTRRWFYYIPAEGEPTGLAHKIEPDTLKPLPGKITHYAGWKDMVGGLQEILEGAGKIAMQFSPNCAVPYVAMVDAGTVDLVRQLGVTVATSANLIQLFESRWSEKQRENHFAAGKLVDQVRTEAFGLISEKQRLGERITEFEVKQFILDQFKDYGLFTDHGPDVAVNQNASNPHYDPTQESCSEIRRGDLVLIDMWARHDRPEGVYYDITWTGFCGEQPPEKIQQVFEVVRDARDQAIAFVKKSVEAGDLICGYQVDDVARNHIREAGYGDYFFHRTGHSIGYEVHGTGANMDNIETHDERHIIPRTCFSIEPGIYLPEFGIRSEVNVFVDEDTAYVTGALQKKLLVI